MRRLIVCVLMAVVSVTATSCDANAGTSERDRFADHLQKTYPAEFEKDVSGATNPLPFQGTLTGAVVLAPTATPQRFDAVVKDVMTYAASPDVSYTPHSVTANGVEVCLGQPSQARRTALRHTLHARQRTLRGLWGCDGYRGRLADFVADAVTVRQVDARTYDLPLRAHLIDVDGDVDSSWHVASALGPTLEAVRGARLLSSFSVKGTTLTVFVEPTLKVAELQRATRHKAGRRLSATVRQGSPGEASAGKASQWAAAADSLRAMPGVCSVVLSMGQLEVRVRTPESVPEVRATLLAFTHKMPTARAKITTQDPLKNDGLANAVASTPQDAELYVHLSHVQGVSHVEVERGRDARSLTVTAEVDEELIDVLPRLKAGVPAGTELIVGPPTSPTVLFTVRPHITAEEITSFGETDPAAVVEAWNSAAGYQPQPVPHTLQDTATR